MTAIVGTHIKCGMSTSTDHQALTEAIRALEEEPMEFMPNPKAPSDFIEHSSLVARRLPPREQSAAWVERPLLFAQMAPACPEGFARGAGTF